MRKKLLASGALVAAAATAFAPAAVSSRNDRGHRGYEVIELTATAAQFGEMTVDPSDELNVGDAFAFSDDLSKGGHAFGDDGGTCVVVRIDGPVGVHHCVATYRLPGGEITAQGLITFNTELEVADAPFTAAVTGGTGAYRRVRGEVDQVPSANGTTGLTFRLLR